MYHAIGPVAARIASAGIGITGGITLADLDVLWIIVAGATLLFAELAICKLLPRRSPARHGSRRLNAREDHITPFRLVNSCSQVGD
jgi:hypothetical protein